MYNVSILQRAQFGILYLFSLHQCEFSIGFTTYYYNFLGTVHTYISIYLTPNS